MEYTEIIKTNSIYIIVYILGIITPFAIIFNPFVESKLYKEVEFRRKEKKRLIYVLGGIDNIISFQPCDREDISVKVFDRKKIKEDLLFAVGGYYDFGGPVYFKKNSELDLIIIEIKLELIKKLEKEMENND